MKGGGKGNGAKEGLGGGGLTAGGARLAQSGASFSLPLSLLDL